MPEARLQRTRDKYPRQEPPKCHGCGLSKAAHQHYFVRPDGTEQHHPFKPVSAWMDQFTANVIEGEEH